MPTDVLDVWCDDAPVGRLERRNGRAAFAYADDWRNRPDPTPLSLSMPLTARDHGDAVVTPFLWGLLPDNGRVLERWAREFRVSDSHPFGFLAHVGEDLPGAMQVLPPDRHPARTSRVAWLDDAEVAELLRAVRIDHTAWLAGSAQGRWSLAGAQPKIALLRDPKRGWGLPSGRSATTHILKPAVEGLDEHDLNEHLCLRAAARLGLRTVRTSVEAFGAERAIVVERYDRIRSGSGWRRLHQEDLCQALGVHPDRKYQSDGGPSPIDVVGVLREWAPPEQAAADARSFAEALMFNWLIAGPDAHAKNYALLLSGPQVRLAPLYDIASALPYGDVHIPKVQLAMKIGGYYLVSAIKTTAWVRLAKDLKLDPDDVVDRVRRMADEVPDAFADAAAHPAVRDLRSRLPRRLVDAVARRANACKDALSATG